jgi:O-acetyl-ADP-ribose deacetylase (regulator of RNase III)
MSLICDLPTNRNIFVRFPLTFGPVGIDSKNFIMIAFKKGNLLDAQVEALVNAVNTVGVMGKGIALQFKNAFPENFKAYSAAVKSGSFQVGKVLLVPVSPFGMIRYVINFPTKEDWRYPSKITWIELGLQDLRIKIRENGIKSIAIPRLGCGYGGLDWNEVRPLIEAALNDLDADIIVYEPSTEIKELLRKEERAPAAKLTPGVNFF